MNAPMPDEFAELREAVETCVHACKQFDNYNCPHCDREINFICPQCYLADSAMEVACGTRKLLAAYDRVVRERDAAIRRFIYQGAVGWWIVGDNNKYDTRDSAIAALLKESP